MRSLKRFWELPSDEKGWLIEAFLLLGFYRAAIALVPLKRLLRPMHVYDPASEPPPERTQESTLRTARRIGRSILRAAGHTPWQSRCLVQALTASSMLRRRRIGGRLYLGVQNAQTSSPLQAHAWSRHADAILTGEEGHERFRILSVWVWTP